jgi:hypothetical protein
MWDMKSLIDFGVPMWYFLAFEHLRKTLTGVFPANFNSIAIFLFNLFEFFISHLDLIFFSFFSKNKRISSKLDRTGKKWQHQLQTPPIQSYSLT